MCAPSACSCSAHGDKSYDPQWPTVVGQDTFGWAGVQVATWGEEVVVFYPTKLKSVNLLTSNIGVEGRLFPQHTMRTPPPPTKEWVVGQYGRFGGSTAKVPSTRKGMSLTSGNHVPHAACKRPLCRSSVWSYEMEAHAVLAEISGGSWPGQVSQLKTNRGWLMHLVRSATVISSDTRRKHKIRSRTNGREKSFG